MKLIKNKISLNKILKLNLIKSKIYEHSIEKHKLTNLKLDKIISSLKNVIYIIYKYHINNKNILFIGTPKVLENKINLKTIHTALPNSINIQNFILNNSIIKGIQLKQKIIKKNRYLLTGTKSKPSLVIIFNEKLNQHIINASYSLKIPVIVFKCSNVRKLHHIHDYKVDGNINSNNTKSVDNVFFIILNALLKFVKKSNS